MEINTKLEKAFQGGETSVTWEEDEDGSRKKWIIDLNKRIETDGTITKEVKRRVIAEGK